MSSNKDISTELQSILTGDIGEYGYLFPFRDQLPQIEEHIFTDFKSSNMKLDQYVVSKMLDINYLGWTAKEILGLNLFPIQVAILQTLWKTPFPMLIASRGGSKSFTLAVYAVLRALLDQGSKIVIVGAGLRQARLVFNYIENIWNTSAVFRSIVGKGKTSGPRQNVDLCYFRIGESIISAIPLGDGTKVRGFRATVVIADEFAVIPPDTFDIVVRGFAATSKTPIDEAKYYDMQRRLLNLGSPGTFDHFEKNDKMKGNQIIYSGTASYAFNHFYKKYEIWKNIIKSKGDIVKVAEIFGGYNMVPENFNYKDYAIIQLPHNQLPKGLLDERQLSHAKAMLPKNIYLMEYGARFVKDSDGFFTRSLIESCTVKPGGPITTPDGEVVFVPMMRGVEGRKFVIGIDPAAEQDNLAIVVLELWRSHARVVYCWAVNKSEFYRRKKLGLITAQDYYEYCCAKIREVTKLFNPVRIEMDSQGGGYPIAEMLRNKKTIDKEKGEFPIYEIIDFNNIKATDSETDGPHILHLVQPSNEFNSQANLALHKNLETKKILFPAFDTVVMQSALVAEKAQNIVIDTFEENVFNIEELKNELCTIQLTETTTGKERFDTPAVVTSQSVEGRQKKGRLRKDRYTAVLLSHKYFYDTETQVSTTLDYSDVAGNFKQIKTKDGDNSMYTGIGVAAFQNANDWANGYKNSAATKNNEKI